MKIQPQFSRNATFALLTLSLLTTVSGCMSSEEDVAPAKTDEYISYKVNGKEYAETSVASLGDEDYLGLWSVVSLTNSVNGSGYSLKLYARNPKVGTFTVQNNSMTGEIALIRSATDIDDYVIPAKGTGTITLSQFDTKGYTEGTFSFVARNSDGQTMTVTDGKFRMDLR